MHENVPCDKIWDYANADFHAPLSPSLSPLWLESQRHCPIATPRLRGEPPVLHPVRRRSHLQGQGLASDECDGCNSVGEVNGCGIFYRPSGT